MNLTLEAPSPTLALAELREALSQFMFRFHTEDDLQQGITQALMARGYDPQREVILGPKDRVDILVNDLAIEVKIDGSYADLLRQVQRYLKHDQVKGALVFGTPAWINRLPVELEGKPLMGLRPLSSLL